MKECKFTDEEVVICAKMAGWKSKINNSFTVEFELWRNAGPSVFQLQEIMLKSDKYGCHEVCHSTIFLNDPRKYC